MSETLTNGYKNPENGDRGSSWFPDLNFNIERVNDHTHNGTNSENINAKDITKSSATIAAASWGSDLGGSTYRQLITLPTGFSFDDTMMKFMISGGSLDGTVIYPSILKASASTYYVYINDNTQALKVTYG